MQEVWKPIPNYEGLYEVSNWGNVRRIPSYHCRGYKTLKPRKTRDGYYETSLSKEHKPKFIRTHRLVAMVFCEKPEGKTEVNHIDGNKLNNRADNLEWVTPSENQKHAYRIGLQRISGGAVLNRKPVECITLGICTESLTEMQRMLSRMGYTNSKKLNRMSQMANESENGYFEYLGLKFRLLPKGDELCRTQ